MDNTVQKVSDEKAKTREQLDALILAEPNNEAAWLQLSEVVEHRSETIDCLEQVIRINPQNSAASQKLNQLRRLEKQNQKPEERVKIQHQHTPMGSGSRQSSLGEDVGGCLVSFLVEVVLSLILSILFPSNS